MKNVEWAKLLEKIYNGEDVSCPECGGKVSSELYANTVSGKKQGFAILKCLKCNEEIRFSRVIFPDSVNTKNY